MIRCLVIDDEPLAIDILKDYIAKVPSLTLVKTFENPIQALDMVNEGNIDLVFLDVQMPQLSGLQFLKIANNKCKVILTTAYTQYALDGFNLDVLDYLLKPIAFERFYKSVQKFIDYQYIATANLKQINNSVEASDFIFVKTEHKIQKIYTHHITHIEGLKDYISIYTATERVITLQNMKKMEDILAPSQFIRVHKSYIVALQKIDSIERSRIFIGDKIIPIGDTYRDLFYDKIKHKNN
ncbi:MAG: DNA-binding response regulator [Sphingobacteriales bacterium]|nr:MAG: DNA-binding response regulator [Sphingobacteriales bacterium]TAF83659.1 MAG: DNA-binding response regulator [Sphingobacteriales bacterium]